MSSVQVPSKPGPRGFHLDRLLTAALGEQAGPSAPSANRRDPEGQERTASTGRQAACARGQQERQETLGIEVTEGATLRPNWPHWRGPIGQISQVGPVLSARPRENRAADSPAGPGFKADE